MAKTEISRAGLVLLILGTVGYWSGHNPSLDYIFGGIFIFVGGILFIFGE